uniref:Uncharacterized protein n=1 Tax=Pseudomonas phage Touem01 TaxID=3138548 RepID=A0AAU6W1T7_9VIRU
MKAALLVLTLADPIEHEMRVYLRHRWFGWSRSRS